MVTCFPSLNHILPFYYTENIVSTSQGYYNMNCKESKKLVLYSQLGGFFIKILFFFLFNCQKLTYHEAEGVTCVVSWPNTRTSHLVTRFQGSEVDVAFCLLAFNLCSWPGTPSLLTMSVGTAFFSPGNNKSASRPHSTHGFSWGQRLSGLWNGSLLSVG